MTTSLSKTVDHETQAQRDITEACLDMLRFQMMPPGERRWIEDAIADRAELERASNMIAIVKGFQLMYRLRGLAVETRFAIAIQLYPALLLLDQSQPKWRQ